MAQKQREFRSAESYTEERISRDHVEPFLTSRGWNVVENHRRKVGQGESQLITACSSAGESVKMRVRLCWRRGGRNANESLYSAAQIRARLVDGDWDKTLDYLTARDVKQGVTHTLLLQRDRAAIVYAALLPTKALKAIWLRQRDVSDILIRSGALGRSRRNHAKNGQSPTLWLQDDRYPRAREVAEALWQYAGVIDLLRQPKTASAVIDDTFDDCPGLDYAQLGRDAGERTSSLRSGVRRDSKVRAKVLERAHHTCERVSCRASRLYPGFLDVHHVLGAESSDRVWTCVALCPNCHREAHLASDAQRINEELRLLALSFAPKVIGKALSQ
jgi:5-methylcytosine-specific restriction protein A